MAKKSKAERKAIRKQGWKEAAQGLHEMYGKTTLDSLAAMGKGFTKGVASARTGNFDPKGNLIGKGLAGIGGAVTGLVKNIPNTAKAMWKGNAKFIKGVFRGIFNHPDWWSYRNTLSIPAYNENRPFDPTSLANIALKRGPGYGVSHVVKNNIVFNDMRNSKSFELAMIEAFKEIRLQLRSNLPYQQSDYNDFIAMAMSVAVKAKAIERVLGWYNVTRPDIPELQEAILSIPSNPNELGHVIPTNIALVNDTNYATTLNQYNKLRAICNNIAIPQKLMEFISWWVASVFIDQKAPNPQLYINELRNAPVYVIDDNNALIIGGSWDIATGTIDTVIEEAMLLANSYGIMNADICKTGKYGTIQLAPVESGTYEPIMLSDPEYFTILINSYTLPKSASNYGTTLGNENYIRVDAVEELNATNMVGVTNALATWAGTVVPLSIISQAAYISTPKSASWTSARNINGTWDISSSNKTYKEDQSDAMGSYWFQISSNYIGSDTINVVDASTQNTYTYSFSNKYTGTGLTNPSAYTINLRASATSVQFVTSFNHVVWANVGRSVNGRYYGFKFTITNGNVTAIVFAYSNTAIEEGAYDPVSTINVATLTANTNYTLSTYVIGSAIQTQIAFKASSVTATNIALSLWTIGSEINAQGPLDTLTVVDTNTARSVIANVKAMPTILGYTQLVDYHLPMIVRNNIDVGDGLHKVTLGGTPVLMKQTFIPLIFNYSDVDAVLYWMYLGLFSMI